LEIRNSTFSKNYLTFPFKIYLTLEDFLVFSKIYLTFEKFTWLLKFFLIFENLLDLKIFSWFLFLKFTWL
jgi:hypothetical protein